MAHSDLSAYPKADPYLAVCGAGRAGGWIQWQHGMQLAVAGDEADTIRGWRAGRGSGFRGRPDEEGPRRGPRWVLPRRGLDADHPRGGHGLTAQHDMARRRDRRLSRAAVPAGRRHEPLAVPLWSASEKDTKLAQKLGQLQPFMAEFLLECTGQLVYCGPT